MAPRRFDDDDASRDACSEIDGDVLTVCRAAEEPEKKKQKVEDDLQEIRDIERSRVKEVRDVRVRVWR